MFEIYLEALIDVERELWPDEKLGAVRANRLMKQTLLSSSSHSTASDAFRARSSSG